MKNYYIYDIDTGEIVSTGRCSDKNYELKKLVREVGTFRMEEGLVDQKRSKIGRDGIRDKTPQEIKDSEVILNPDVPSSERIRYMTEGEYQSILSRLAALETSP
jgi:hypothetical protein